MPLFRHVLCASTPRRHCCHRSARRYQATDMFRPRGFAPPRRLTPRKGYGLIASRNQMEFVTFPSCAPIFHRPKSTTDGRRSPFPATRFTPFKEFPSPVAVPHHCGRYPPAVLSRRVRSLHRSARLDRLRANRSPSHSPLSQPKPLERVCHVVATLTLTGHSPRRNGGSSPLHCVCLLPRRGLGRSTHPTPKRPM